MARKPISFFALINVFVFLSSCALILVADGPTSANVPNADFTGVDAISKLNYTIWYKSDDNTYLFIEDSRFAIKKYPSNMTPGSFPKDYEYTHFDQSCSLGSQLQRHRAVIYSITTEGFIGFNLIEDRKLIVTRATLGAIVRDDLENDRGSKWDLYI